MGASSDDLVRYTKWDKGVSFQERIVDWTENESILIVPGYQNRPSNTIQ